MFLVVASSATTSSPTHHANICSQNVSIGAAVIAAVNLTYPGMGTVAAAASAKDYGAACEALAVRHTCIVYRAM